MDKVVRAVTVVMVAALTATPSRLEATAVLAAMVATQLVSLENVRQT